MCQNLEQSGEGLGTTIEARSLKRTKCNQSNSKGYGENSLVQNDPKPEHLLLGSRARVCLARHMISA